MLIINRIKKKMMHDGQMMDVDEIRTILSEGGDQTEAYTRVKETLNRLKREGDITFYLWLPWMRTV